MFCKVVAPAEKQAYIVIPTTLPGTHQCQAMGTGQNLLLRVGCREPRMCFEYVADFISANDRSNGKSNVTKALPLCNSGMHSVYNKTGFLINSNVLIQGSLNQKLAFHCSQAKTFSKKENSIIKKTLQSQQAKVD